MPGPGYIMAALLAAAFTLTTWLQPAMAARAPKSAASRNVLAMVMGDAQRLFAGLVFRKADVYFHSGYYPSIFDSAHTNEMHIAEQAAGSTEMSRDAHEGQGHHEGETAAEHAAHAGHDAHQEEGMDFLNTSRDWLETLRHQAINTKHTHLDETGRVAEMLPWLKMSAELDPQRVETYIITSFWLRGSMKQPDKALDFLREGWRNNPDSHEILFEMGRLYRENYQDNQRAQSVLDLAYRKLQAAEQKTGETDVLATRQILVLLAQVEEAQTNYPAALQHLERLLPVIPADLTEARKQTEEEIARLRKLGQP